MSISNCPVCGKWIDEDYDVEHYENCEAEANEMGSLEEERRGDYE